MATFEEARQCPRCGKPMEATITSNDPVIKREIYTTTCHTEGCPWFGTGRIIQLDNGIVFERAQGTRGQDKTFPTLTPSELAHGQRMIEDVKGRDLRDE